MVVRVTLSSVTSELLRDHMTTCPIAAETLGKACVEVERWTRAQKDSQASLLM